MNKIYKSFIAIIGATNIVFNLFLPLAIVLMIIKIYNFTGFTFYFLILVGFISTMYRAIDIADLETIYSIIKGEYKNGRI